jgi:AAA family ATP:ADP antiporter
VLVTSGVSGLDKLGASLASIALIGTGIASVAAFIARKAAHSPDLAPEQRSNPAVISATPEP